MSENRIVNQLQWAIHLSLLLLTTWIQLKDSNYLMASNQMRWDEMRWDIMNEIFRFHVGRSLHLVASWSSCWCSSSTTCLLTSNECIFNKNAKSFTNESRDFSFSELSARQLEANSFAFHCISLHFIAFHCNPSAESTNFVH